MTRLLLFSLRCATWLVLILGQQACGAPVPSPQHEASEAKKGVAAYTDFDEEAARLHKPLRPIPPSEFPGCPEGTTPQTGGLVLVEEWCVDADGLRQGPYVEWFEPGLAAGQGEYAADLKEGLWTSWDRDGLVIIEGSYKDGKKDGEWFAWFVDSDAVGSRTGYKNGKLEGVDMEWHPNGQKESEAFYINGRPEEEMVQWASDGTVLGVSRMLFGNGCFRRWYNDGTLMIIGPLRHGEQALVWTRYNEDGTVGRQCDFSAKGGTRCVEDALLPLGSLSEKALRSVQRCGPSAGPEERDEAAGEQGAPTP